MNDEGMHVGLIWFWFDLIVDGLAPQHLLNIFRSYDNRNRTYQLRHQNIQIIHSRTETFRCSFFPSCIRSWNLLDQNIKCSVTLSEFKSKLFKNKKKKNAYYNYGVRKINCILSSIRLGCSQLNGDLFDNNLILNNRCLCGNVETAFHYFF